jgi:primosomal protein N'
MKGYHRYHVQLHAPADSPLDQVVRGALTATDVPRLVEIAVDVDPISML